MGARPISDDIRQGVTFTQQTVLDHLSLRQRQWSQIDIDTQIELARIDASDARNMLSCAYKHSKLIDAVSRLLDAAERIAPEALRG